MISECFKFSKVGLFADDKLLYATNKDPIVAAQQLNEDLARVQTWLNINKLTLEKTKCMLINCKRADLIIQIDNSTIEYHT